MTPEEAKAIDDAVWPLTYWKYVDIEFNRSTECWCVTLGGKHFYGSRLSESIIAAMAYNAEKKAEKATHG